MANANGYHELGDDGDQINGDSDNVPDGVQEGRVCGDSDRASLENSADHVGVSFAGVGGDGGLGGNVNMVDGGARNGTQEGMRERMFSNQSLSHVTLKDMEDGNTLSTLYERLQQCVNMTLEISGG